MHHRLLACALLCALSAPAAFAAEPAAAPATVKWIVPWQKGMALEYAWEDRTTQAREKVRSVTRTTSTTTVRIVEASKDGWLQRWESRDDRYETLEGDDPDSASMRALMQAMEGTPLDIVLDAAGNYASVRNLGDIAPRLRTAVTPMVEAAAEAELAKIADPKLQADARKTAKANVAAFVERMTEPKILQAMLSREISTFNGFVGLDLEPDQSYEVATELPNPVGGPAFPAKLTLSMSLSKDDPDDLFVAFDQVIDAEKSAAGIAALGAQVAGVKLDEKAVAATKLDIRDEGLFVVHRPTGVIEMFETTRTSHVAGKEKIERTRMRQLNGEHDHVWLDEQEAGEVEAADG